MSTFRNWLLPPVLGMLALPMTANADTLTGVIKGASCVHEQHMCPEEASDPHVMLETDFVLAIGDKHYLMPNLARDLKVRYVMDTVQIVGDINENFHSIDVDELKVKKGDTFKKVWSRADQQRVLRQMYGSGS